MATGIVKIREFTREILNFQYSTNTTIMTDTYTVPKDGILSIGCTSATNTSGSWCIVVNTSLSNNRRGQSISNGDSKFALTIPVKAGDVLKIDTYNLSQMDALFYVM